MLSATVGQMLVNEALPEDMRDYNRVLDGKGVKSLLQQVAKQYPERYREVSFNLNQIGRRSAQDQGGMSFGVRHLRRSNVANEIRQRIQNELRGILADDSLTNQQRNEKIIRVVGRESAPQQKAVLEEALKAKNPLALQVLSGSRGKPMNLASLLASDMLYSDHRDEVIPIPVLRSYSEGLSPEEYWAGTYGARRGIIATKFATQEAGFLSKQLNQAGHRLVVMGEDADEEGPDAPVRGMIVDTDDMDNEGALLARDMGPYKKNTPLTPKILKHLSRLGKNRILVRSPLVGGSPEGGVYARDVGIRENGTLPGRGEQVGLQAAQALSEPISQGQLSAKHSGGVAGQEKAVGGFQYINQLIQTPQRMQGGAAHSTVDGTVQRVEPAPAGGHYVTINDEKHYVGEGFGLKVKKGDEVEAGDMLSDGIPNPAIITKYKGVGEGRRYFVDEFRKAMATSGMQGHRRNIELLARGLINHVQLTDEIGDHVPDDIIPYSTLEHTYKPREGHERLTPKKAVGQYLERPVLHYTIGTRIRPSMLKNFDEFGVNEIPVHRDPPPFQPHMVRGMYQLQHDPDWMTQMYGSGLKKSLLESTARGATSEERGTSFIPSLATGTDFGEVADRAVIQPKPGYAAPKFVLPDPEEPEAPPASGSMFFGNKFKVASVKRADSATPVTSQPPASSLAPPGGTPKITPPKGLTADQLAENPPIRGNTASKLKQRMGVYEKWVPDAAGDMKGGKNTSTEYNSINENTGQHYDRYHNPVNGTYSPDGTSWTAGDAQSFLNPNSNIMPQVQQNSSIMPQVQPNAAAVPMQYPQQNSVQAPSLSSTPKFDYTTFLHTTNRMTNTQSPTNYDYHFADRPEPVQSSAPATELAPNPQYGNSSDQANVDLRQNIDLAAGLGRLGLYLKNWGQGTAGAGSAAVPSGVAATAENVAPSLIGRAWQGTKSIGNFAKDALRATALTTAGQHMPGLSLMPGLPASPAGTRLFSLARAGGLGRAGLAGMGAQTALNAGTEALDFAGLLPQSVGGKGMGRFGWDLNTFDDNTKKQDYISGAETAYQNPLKSLALMGTQAHKDVQDKNKEMMLRLQDGKTEKQRAIDENESMFFRQERNRQEELLNKINNLDQIATSGNLSPQQEELNTVERNELKEQINASKAESNLMNDETKNWQLGNTSWIGKNSPFKAKASIELQKINQVIGNLEQKGVKTPEDQAQLEYFKRKQNDYTSLLNIHNREVGYSGVGGFADYMRQTVRNKQRNMLTLGQEMREAAMNGDSARVEQLQKERQYLYDTLQDYRSWAGQSNP